MKKCPCCGNEILSEWSNFCAYCGKQLHEIPAEDAKYIAPENERNKPMPVKVVYLNTKVKQ